jgi:hypothetical protein
MKKFIKNIIPFFGTSFSLITHPLPKIVESFSRVKEIFINTTIEKKVQFKDNIENHQSYYLKKEKATLNKTKVFLLVKTQVNTKQKSEKNNLLLIETEIPLNIAPENKKALEGMFFYNLTHTWSKTEKLSLKTRLENSMPIGLTKWVIDRYTRRSPIARPGLKDNYSLAQGLRGAPHFLGGKNSWKSISPVFLEEKTAKSFLMENVSFIENIIETNEEIKNISMKEKALGNLKKSKNTSKYLNNETLRHKRDLTNIKIVCLGLGDFIEYYSAPPNDKQLEKVEFLFFPNLEALSKTRKNSVCVKGFKAYQQQLYKSKNIGNTKNS